MPFPLSRDRRIGGFYDYWNGLRDASGIPSQRSFDPIEIAPLLRHIWMARWAPEVGDFVYRIAGESVMAAVGTTMRHRSLAEIYTPQVAEELRLRFQKVCATPLLYHSAGPIYVHLERYGTGERLILPLVDEHGGGTVVIGCSIYATAGDADDREWIRRGRDREVRTYMTPDADLVEEIREAC